MYQILCDGYVLYDPRDDELIVNNPKCKLGVNTVGSASFSIYATHPFYSNLKKLRSVFEIRQDSDVIFRGRMTESTRDFNNIKAVDLEGVMAYFNDSIIRPFVFPDDFTNDEVYTTAAEGGNVVEYLLGWVISQHNAQVQDFQKIKLGKVTVSDPNNYITRSATDYKSAWETLKSALFESSLEGFLCIRYEEDGNYIDYLSDFELTNTQRIVYGENLLDLTNKSSGTSTYTAMIPLGGKVKDEDDENSTETQVTIEGLADGAVTEDIIKEGDTIFSRSAVDKYGWICAPISESKWDDVTEADNLLEKATEKLSGKAVKLTDTITIKAVDLHFSDADIAAFRIYRHVLTYSKPHGHEGQYKLTELDIDILNPQNTKITLGDTIRTLTDINRGSQQKATDIVTIVQQASKEMKNDLTEVQNIVKTQSSSVVATCEEIILSALSEYVEDSNYQSFKETVESQLKVLADEIALNFTTVMDQVENVNGDLQERFNTITKYFTFNINGLTIGQTDSPYKVVIDNDRYSMRVNDVEVLWIANGEVYTPEIEITKKMNLFGYLIDQDENGNVNCEYIGGGA